MKTLRELALAATPGPWKHKWKEGLLAVYKGAGYRNIAVITPLLSGEQEEQDAAYIAACSPDAILALLDERNRFKAAFDEWHNKTEWVQQAVSTGTLSGKYLGCHRADVMVRNISEIERERDALRTELEALKASK